MALIQQAKAWEYLLLFGAPQPQSAILSPVPLFGICPLADFQSRLSPVGLDPPASPGAAGQSAGSGGSSPTMGLKCLLPVKEIQVWFRVFVCAFVLLFSLLFLSSMGGDN